MTGWNWHGIYRLTVTEGANNAGTRIAKARERVAQWAREIGVVDPELQPNHAWRHTFKKIGERANISEKMLDRLCG